MPFTLNAPVHSDQTLKKSRFIGCVEPVADRAAAVALYQQQISSVANATLEFNHDSRHFIMLDQPDWLAARIARALKD